jgi:DNA-binding beta-propeller fold protein YncE
MPISRRAIAVLAFLPALAIHGQQRQVSGPVAGYVFDGAALRLIDGVPGGATLGGALDLGLAASAVAVSPQLGSVIVTAGDGSLHLFRLSGNSATEVWWNGLPSGPARVVYSPSGTAAAVYAAGRVQVFAGLPNAPLAAFAAELGSSQAEPGRKPTSAAPEAMAVSDDGAWLLVASEGRLRLLGASGSSSVLLEGARGVSVAFAPSGHAAAVLNGAGQWLDVFPDISAAPSQRIPAPGLTEPVGLSFSADGKLVLAASSTAKSVTVFNLAGAATTLDCDCTPTGVSRMGRFFRLTDAGSGPVWLLDANTSPSRIVFVPARVNP